MRSRIDSLCSVGMRCQLATPGEHDRGIYCDRHEFAVPPQKTRNELEHLHPSCTDHDRPALHCMPLTTFAQLSISCIDHHSPSMQDIPPSPSMHKYHHRPACNKYHHRTAATRVHGCVCKASRMQCTGKRSCRRHRCLSSRSRLTRSELDIRSHFGFSS